MGEKILTACLKNYIFCFSSFLFVFAFINLTLTCNSLFFIITWFAMMECSFNVFVQDNFVERGKDVNGIKILPACSKEILPGILSSWRFFICISFCIYTPLCYALNIVLQIMRFLSHLASMREVISFQSQHLWVFHLEIYVVNFSYYSCWHWFFWNLRERHSTMNILLT